MAVEIKFLIDNLDRGQPLNPEDFGINITTDDNIGARIVSFDNELTFGGDVFTYLYTKLETSGYCELVRVSVQYLCNSGTWEKLVDGYIIVTESNFLLDRCQVKTKLYDETFSTKINNNKSIPFSLSLSASKNDTPITPPVMRRLDIFNPPTGTYEAQFAYGYALYDVFQHLINCMSDGLIDFASNFFSYTYPDASLPVYTQGNVLRQRQPFEMTATFEKLYLAMKQKLNLGIGFEKQANGRPLLRIEPIAYFQQSGASANLYDQPEIEMKFDTTRLYAAVDFGSDPFLEQAECDGGNTACTFVQTPFRGFRIETFGFIGECNTSNVLNLKSGDIIFDANVIEDVIRFASPSHDLSNFIIQSSYDNTFAANGFIAIKYDPYTIGQTLYNGLYTNINVSANWLSGYPNSLFSFLNAPFTPAQAACEVRIGAFPFPVFDANDNAVESYFGWNGAYIPFTNQFNDPNNLYAGDSYVCPYAGVYTITLQLIRDSGADPTVGNVANFCSIVRRDANDTFIAEVPSFPPVTQTYPSFSLVTVTTTFVCNQGDKISANFYAQVQNGTNIPIRIADTTGGGGPVSYMDITAVPLNANNPDQDLDPVNIDDVQAYLYKFKRPLTMAEINAITSETSKPIQLGRRDDSLAVIDTYIKNIQIESVMRKAAQFELRSNKLLP
jgi:hypothetical protein